MKSNICEIFEGIFRLSIAPNNFFEFNQFLILDEKVCLVHTGKLSFFDELKAMAQQCLDGRKIDYIVFSHFEPDECGSINEWLQHFPDTEVYCNKIASTNLSDFLLYPAKVIKDRDVLPIGKRRLKLVDTPHFPHNQGGIELFSLI